MMGRMLARRGIPEEHGGRVTGGGAAQERALGRSTVNLRRVDLSYASDPGPALTSRSISSLIMRSISSIASGPPWLHAG
jgi:hypothetical protein